MLSNSLHPVSPARRWRCSLVIGAAACLLPTSVSRAQQSEAAPQLQPVDTEPVISWPAAEVGTLRTFFERVDVEEVMLGLEAPDRAVGSAEVAALSATLAAGIEAPFRFVRMRVRHEPYLGSIRGARGALLAASANSLDQTLLLAGLYRARGLTVRLARGRLAWRDAVALVGEPAVPGSGHGDPWLRWIEMTSDHWWLELRRGGEWVALDPSFAGTAVGESVAERAEIVDVVPMPLRTHATLRLRLDDATLAHLELPLDELIGASVRVEGRVHSGPVDPEPAEDAEALPDESVPEEALDEEAAAQARLAAALADVLSPVPVGPVALVLSAADHTATTAPLELGDLARVDLQIDVDVPLGSGMHTRIPFGADPLASLAVIVASGPMPRAHLRDRVVPLFDSLSDLSAVEIKALKAWTARPRESESELPAGLSPEPIPLPAESTVEAGDPEHPATALHIAALRSWRVLEKDGLDAIAVALLVAGESLRPRSKAYRGALRMAAVQWTPPAMEAEGRLTVWMSDSLRVGGLEREQRSGLAGAYGLLRAALTGQVLNRVADRPPVTAFDVTLRAVGSGGRLQWWRGEGDLPQLWPGAARAAAQADLADGRLLAGLARPVDHAGETLHGWWGVLDGSGQTLGRVLTPSGVAQGFVRFARSRDEMSMDSVLATLHELHAAFRWLIGAASDDGQALASLLPGACAATPLVTDLLRAGAPDDTVAPTFEAFCAGQP